jgi:hypothetical protein
LHWLRQINAAAAPSDAEPGIGLPRAIALAMPAVGLLNGAAGRVLPTVRAAQARLPRARNFGKDYLT